MNEEYLNYLKSVVTEHQVAREQALANVQRCEAAIIIAREALAKYEAMHTEPATT